MNNIERLTLDSFKPICILGKGSYAHVVLAEALVDATHQYDQHFFALKIMDKADIQIRNIKPSLYIEKEILQSLKDCKFTTSLFATFQDEEEICFLLEYCPGGDLFELLSRKKLFDENSTRFYMAQLILGLEYIHKTNIIYRDLKPENILIDSEGNLKIADFGRAIFTKRFGDKVQGISGTLEYMAPEMTKEEFYDNKVDIWSLGCILYEMITGKSPFVHKNQKKLFELIQKKGFFMPHNINNELQDLLTKLLKKNPDKRISLKEIKQHKWFENFNWKAAENFSLPTPWKPNITKDGGICNFNTKFVSMNFDLITCGLDKGTYLPNFYYENEAIKELNFMEGKSKIQNQHEEIDSDNERDDENWGEMNSFQSDSNSNYYNDDYEYESDNEWSF